jgi:hypothetical protein
MTKNELFEKASCQLGSENKKHINLVRGAKESVCLLRGAGLKLDRKGLVIQGSKSREESEGPGGSLSNQERRGNGGSWGSKKNSIQEHTDHGRPGGSDGDFFNQGRRDHEGSQGSIGILLGLKVSNQLVLGETSGGPWPPLPVRPCNVGGLDKVGPG